VRPPVERSARRCSQSDKWHRSAPQFTLHFSEPLADPGWLLGVGDEPGIDHRSNPQLIEAASDGGSRASEARTQLGELRPVGAEPNTARRSPHRPEAFRAATPLWDWFRHTQSSSPARHPQRLRLGTTGAVDLLVTVRVPRPDSHALVAHRPLSLPRSA